MPSLCLTPFITSPYPARRWTPGTENYDAFYTYARAREAAMEPAELFGDDAACADDAAATAAAPALHTIAPDADADGARCLSPRVYTNLEVAQAHADLLAMLHDSDMLGDTSYIVIDPITACPLLSDDALASMLDVDADVMHLFYDLPAAETPAAPISTAAPAVVHEQLTISAAAANILSFDTSAPATALFSFAVSASVIIATVLDEQTTISAAARTSTPSAPTNPSACSCPFSFSPAALPDGLVTCTTPKPTTSPAPAPPKRTVLTKKAVAERHLNAPPLPKLIIADLTDDTTTPAADTIDNNFNGES